MRRLTLLLCILVIAEAQTPEPHIEELKNQPGIAFDKIKNIVIAKGQWELYTFVNLSDIIHSQFLAQSATELTTIIAEYTNNSDLASDVILKDSIRELVQKEEDINKLLTVLKFGEDSENNSVSLNTPIPVTKKQLDHIVNTFIFMQHNNREFTIEREKNTLFFNNDVIARRMQSTLHFKEIGERMQDLRKPYFNAVFDRAALKATYISKTVGLVTQNLEISRDILNSVIDALLDNEKFLLTQFSTFNFQYRRNIAELRVPISIFDLQIAMKN